MKKSFSKLIYPIFYAMILIVSFSCSDESLDVEQEENAILNTSIEKQIFKLVNEHRSEIGKQSLQLNTFANDLAKEHTLYMIDKNTISHDNFNNRFGKLSNTEKATRAGENVASGQETAQSVMTAWLNSNGHKKNIEGDYTHIGISALKNKSGTYYYTQLFLKK